MAGITSPIFVGRAAELAVLDAALEAASQGLTTIVLIGGDAGVGKSRLLATWNGRAREAGARVVSGGCLDLGESGPAYVSIVQAFRDLLAPLDVVAVDALVGSDRPTLGRVIPELVVGSSGTTHDDEPFTPVAQTRLFDRLARVLERASSASPLVVELEDIHWADPSTRAFLVFLAANARSGRLLIVATFRAEEAGVDHPLTSTLRQLGRHPRCEAIELLPFDTDELREQLGGILGQPPATGLLSAVQARSEGNALFTEELIASGDPTSELPTSIGAALLSRTAGLSPDARLTLRVASVAGRTASYDLLRSATMLSDQRLDGALHEAVGASILEREAPGERYRFRHALLQEAIYQDTLPGERRRFHAAVAEALEADARKRPDNAEIASRLAYHWFEARNPDRALTASIAAGDAAVHRAAYAEALHQYERVLELWDEASPAHADLGHADMLERTAHSADLAGESHKATVYARRLLDELDAADDPILRVRALHRLSAALEGMNKDDEAVDYRRQLAATDTADLPVREALIVLDSRAWMLRWEGDLVAAIAAAMEAARLADTIDDTEVQARAHLETAWMLLDNRDFDGALGEARRAEDLASIADDAENAIGARTIAYLAHADSGQYEMAITAARETRAFADQVGLSQWEGTSASMVEARALLHLGRIAEGATLIEAALLDPPRNPTVLLQFHLLAAEVAIIRGDYRDAATHLEAARSPGSTLDEENGRGWLATVRAELAIAEGRLEDVRTVVHATATRLMSAPPVPLRGHWIWGLVAIGLDAEATRTEAVRAGGDEAAIAVIRGAANELLGYIDDVRRQRRRSGMPDRWSDRRDEALMTGHMARIAGRDDPSLWAVAAELFPPRSPGALAARYRQAEAMVSARMPRDEIRSVMADAHAAAIDIGARPLAGRFEALARRARVDLRLMAAQIPEGEVVLAPEEPASPGAVALRARGLSDREIEVLALVAAGFSNHDIGLRLFITDKTASAHVSHILAKLDAATRTEAATIGVRLGLPDIERDDQPA